MQNIMTELPSKTRNYNPYARGRRFEYRTKDYLKKLGWFVVRQPKSTFPDIIALRDGSILVIECKVDGYIPSTKRRHIVRLARKQIGGRAILAFRRGRELLLSELSPKSAKFDKPFDPQVFGFHVEETLHEGDQSRPQPLGRGDSQEV